MNYGMRAFIPLALAAVLILASSAPALPQASSGILTGRVSDTSNALIPGAGVTIASPAMIGGVRNALSDEQGSYRFNLLPPGDYSITVELPGFKTMKFENVNVRVGVTTTINATMEVAALAETVTITDESPTIDVEQATVGVNFNQKLLDNLPNSRDIWIVLSQTPGVFMTSYDVGGSSMGTSSGYRTYGSSGGSYILTDGIVTGGHYSDYGAYQEIQIAGAAKGAEAPTPGAYINAVIKSGGNDVHGTIYGDWEDDKFQGSNLNDTLRRRGVTSGAKFTRYNDINFDIGGPIVKDKFWYYGSYRDQYSGLQEPGFVDRAGNLATSYTKLQDPTVKLTYQITARQKIDFMAQLGRKYQPFRHTFSDAAFIPAESTQIQDSWSGIGKSSWQMIVSPKTTLDAQLSRWGWWWPAFSHVNEISERDITTRKVRGGYSGQGGGTGNGVPNYSRPIRWQWNSTLNHFTNLKGNHEIKVGYIGWHYTSLNEDRGTVNHQIYYYNNNFTTPNYVLVYNTPNSSINGDVHHGFFINDRWNIGRRLTLSLGLRFDRYHNFYRQQGNTGSGPWAARTTIPERVFEPFNNWVPRVSFVYDVLGTGRFAFKASYGRYYEDPGVGIASSSNPNELIRRRYRWNGQIPYIPQPADLLAQETGGSDRDVVKGLKNQFTDEYTTGIDVQLSNDYSVRFNIVRKFDKQGRQTMNVALPFEAFTDTILRSDIGRDNVAGTSDDRQIVVFSVPRANPNFGRNITRLMNQAGIGNNYTSWETSFNKRFSDRWQFLIGYNRDFRDVRGSIPTNPNQAYYESNLGYHEWAFKMLGTFEGPWGMNFSSVYKAQSGEPFGRDVQVQDRNGSTQTLRVERMAGRYPAVKVWDARIGRTFKMNDRHGIEAIFDLFNILNSSAILSQGNTTGTTAFGRVTQILQPRIFRLGVRWTF